MRDRLASALRTQFEQEIRRSTGRIRSPDALDRVRAELERELPVPVRP